MRFLFVHGGFHAAWCWDSTIAELAALGHEGVAVDLPGHGRRVDEESTLANRRDAIASELQPGDILLSGTPAISRTVYPGDVVEVEVEGLGTLRNHIVEGPTPIRTDVGAQPTESEEVLSTAKGGDWEFRGVRKPNLSGTP